MTTTYYGNVNPELLAWMPLTARHVLELGCGTGALAAAYRERNPAARYTAVEAHAASAEEARARVDRLIVGDFGAIADEELAVAGGYDMIVLGDVLEHLVDAEAVLRRLARLLADEGHLVLSVPNIAHWSAIAQLIQGRWPRADSGLFDRTHLRFFTLDSLRSALAEGGFLPLRIRPRNVLLDRQAAETWTAKLADAAGALGVDREAFVQRSAALQYVVVAQKAERRVPAPLRLSVSAMAPRLMEVRARLPADALASAPDLIVGYHEKAITLPAAAIDAPKILVVQRPGVPDQAEWLRTIATAVSRGWLVVTEFDDDPDLVARVLRQDKTKAERWLPFAAVHAVQTSTAALRTMFLAYNPEVAAFPNAVFARPPLRERPGGPLRVFYGALNRGRFAEDVAASLAPAIATIPGLAFDVVHDRAFFDALPTANKRFQPTLDYEAYLAALGSCDVALMPLEGREEERGKSDLKFLEAASRGVVSVASPTVYAGSIDDGRTGVLVDRRAGWAGALIELADETIRGRIAQAAWEHVGDERMFAHQVRARIDWYKSLWTRREQLDAALLERIPGMAAHISAVKEAANKAK